MTNTVDTVAMDIEAALQAAETALPTILGIVGVFYAPAKALVPFLPLLQVALTTVQQVQTVLDQDIASAMSTVTNTLTTSVPAQQTAPSTPLTPAQ